VASGALKVRIGHRYKLEDAAQAHRDLEGRRTTGKVLLTLFVLFLMYDTGHSPAGRPVIGDHRQM
jgi:hypothetical protein